MTVKILLNGLRYFAIVFALGFLLGTVRVLLLVPRTGEAVAELIEIPVILVCIFFIARWLHRRYPQEAGPWILSGLIALALLLSFEFTVVLAIRGMSIGEWFVSRDPLAFAAYLASLPAFALMPAFVARKG